VTAFLVAKLQILSFRLGRLMFAARRWLQRRELDLGMALKNNIVFCCKCKAAVNIAFNRRYFSDVCDSH